MSSMMNTLQKAVLDGIADNHAWTEHVEGRTEFYFDGYLDPADIVVSMLKALRNPSNEVALAGANAAIPLLHCDSRSAEAALHQKARFNAMIDAILKEVAP